MGYWPLDTQTNSALQKSDICERNSKFWEEYTVSVVVHVFILWRASNSIAISSCTLKFKCDGT
jgi:hypothetical protein